MAVLSSIPVFFIIHLVAIYKMKVIWNICVMILINFWIILFDVHSVHLCRVKNNFIILFVYVQNVWKKNLECYSRYSTEYSILHHTFTHFIQNSGDYNYVYSDISFLYIHKQNRKYIIIVLSCSQLSLHWKLYQTCTFRYITTGLMIQQ